MAVATSGIIRWGVRAASAATMVLLLALAAAGTAGAGPKTSVWNERGVFTWYLPNPLVSDSTAFAKQLKRNNFSWVAVWAHDGSIARNEEFFAQGWLKPFRKLGIKVCAWGGLDEDPEGNARAAMQAMTKWRFDCYIANAEDAYKADSGGDPGRSARFVSALKLDVPLALSTNGAACKPWNLSAVFDYVPWRNAGYDLLPQAYWNVSECYEPHWVIQHSLEAGWPIERVHPTVGIFQAERGRLTGADYAPLLDSDGATGFSAYLAEEMTEADYAALSTVK